MEGVRGGVGTRIGLGLRAVISGTGLGMGLDLRGGGGALVVWGRRLGGRRVRVRDL